MYPYLRTTALDWLLLCLWVVKFLITEFNVTLSFTSFICMFLHPVVESHDQINNITLHSYLGDGEEEGNKSK